MQYLWSRFKKFIWTSLTEKFRAFMPGVLMGFVGSKHLLWALPIVSVVEYGLKFAGTIFMAFGSGLATSYAAYLIEQHKKKKDDTPSRKRKKTDRAA